MKNDPTQQAEIMIYAVTSDSKGAPHNGSPYSMPSNLVKVCSAFGLSSKAFIPFGVTPQLLTLIYFNEISNAQKHKESVVRIKAPKPIGEQRLLRVLRVERNSGFINTGLHYVLERPDGSIMDPALGWDHTSFD